MCFVSEVYFNLLSWAEIANIYFRKDSLTVTDAADGMT